MLHLPDGSWADLLTGREYAGATLAHELLADLPVALLISTGSIDGPGRSIDGPGRSIDEGLR